MNTGLELRTLRIDSKLPSRRHEEVQALLLSMKNNNGDREQSVDRKDHCSSRPSQTRPGGGRHDEPTGAPVKQNRQRSGQRDTNKWDHADKDAESACLESGTNCCSPVHRPAEHALPALKGCQPRLRDLRGKTALCCLGLRGNFGLRNRNRYVNLRSAALRTERPTILDRSPTLLAGVFHPLKLAHNEPREQGGQGPREIEDQTPATAKIVSPTPSHPLDGVVLAGMYAHVNQSKARSLTTRLNGDDVLVSFRSYLQLQSISAGVTST